MGHSYYRTKVTDSELFNFYRKYTVLKSTLEQFEEELEAYKAEVLDVKDPVNDRLSLKQNILKIAYMHLAGAYEELINARTYDPDYVEGVRV